MPRGRTGTERNGLKKLVVEVHKFGDYYVDFVINHNGYSDAGRPAFVAAGGYLSAGSADAATIQAYDDFAATVPEPAAVWLVLSAALAGMARLLATAMSGRC